MRNSVCDWSQVRGYDHFTGVGKLCVVHKKIEGGRNTGQGVVERVDTTRLARIVNNRQEV